MPFPGVNSIFLLTSFPGMLMREIAEIIKGIYTEKGIEHLAYT